MVDGSEIKARLLEKRILGIGDDITDEVVDDLRKSLLQLALESKEEVRLLIDTNGGHAEPSLWLVDLMRMVDVPIVGIVIGRCKSMGVVILQACTKRLATPHSWFYVHSTSSTFQYSIGEKRLEERFQIELESSRQVFGQVVDILATRTKKTPEEIRRLCENGDETGGEFTAQQAKDLGLIDEVVDESCKLFAELPQFQPDQGE